MSEKSERKRNQMRNVLQKAQELAEAILQSDVYQRSRTAEEKMTADPEAAKCLADYLEKQRAVNEILSTEDMDAAKLAEAGAALQEAEDRLHANPLVKETQDANAACNEMLENVNRIIQLIVKGQTEDTAGCTGNCASCGGCGHGA